MKRLRLAVIGYGKVGQACVAAAREAADLEIAGIVRRPESVLQPLPAQLRKIKVAGHVSELGRLDAALVCVPTEAVLGVARELLQQGVPLVESASLEGHLLEAHREAIHRVAESHRVAAIVGAGWDSGALTEFRRLFELLIPRGHTEISNRPAASLYHSAAAQQVAGVKAALCSELRTPQGGMQRYLYVELERGADPERVAQAIRSDPLFVGEETLVFPVEDLAALEQAGHGIVMERRGAGRPGSHNSLVLEARFDPALFTAQVMLDAARALPGRRPGAHAYALSR